MSTAVSNALMLQIMSNPFYEARLYICFSKTFDAIQKGQQV